MADHTDVGQHFIQPMLRHFLAPQVDDEQAMWRDFQIDLGGFDEKTLAEAAVRLRRREGGSLSFPRLGDCLSMCQRIRFEREASRKAAERASSAIGKRKAYRDYLDAKETEALVCDEMGQRAAREGWISGLYSFVQGQGRLPDDHEAEQLKRKHAANDADWRELSDNGGALARLAWSAIQRRRERLSGMVFEKRP